MGFAHTNVIAHAGRFYALHETDKPYELRLTANGFDTLERSTFDGALMHPVAAHPKVDWQTDEMMLFGYDLGGKPGQGGVYYSVLQPDATISSTATIDVPHPVLLHDICITQHYTILFDPNFQFQVRCHTYKTLPNPLTCVHVNNV